jgi:cytochrome b561
MRYDLLTRLHHLIIAAGITAQMLTSLVMVNPRPGRLPNEWYEVHETIGMILLAVVVLYWLRSVARSLARGSGLRLFPWFSKRLLGDLRDDVALTSRLAAKMQLPPEGDEPRPLPAAVQGAGLLLALALAATGTTVALSMAPDGATSPVIHAIKEIHGTIGPLMWVYLVVHPVLGILHQLAGHDSLSRMFGFRG